MKRALIVLLLVSGIISSCKKDKENKPEVSLYGKWLAQEKVESTFEGGIEVDRKSNDAFTEKDYIVFNGDGTAVSSYEGAGLQHSIYSVVGRTLTLAAASNPNEITKFEIKLLTETNLVVVRQSVEIIQNVSYTNAIQVSFRRI